MRTLLFILLTIITLACNQNSKKVKATLPSDTIITVKNIEEKVTNQEVLNNTVEDTKAQTPDDSLRLNGVLGLLVCENVYDSIFIYNSDSTVFTRFTYKGDDTKIFYDNLYSKVKQFKLNAYHPDYGLLIFPSSPFGKWYEIFLTDDTPKFIPRNTKLFKFYTWQEYLFSGSYVSIDDTRDMNPNNPFHELKDTTSAIIDFNRKQDEIYFINAVTIENDWVKVCCEYDNGDKRYGWIKWRILDKFILKFFLIL